jgi:hypothetical protein
VWQHALDTCDKCNSPMDAWKTAYPEDGYNYLSWVCQDDDCGDVEDRHEYLLEDIVRNHEDKIRRAFCVPSDLLGDRS